MEYIRSGHYDIVRNDYGRQMVIPSEKEWVELKRGKWEEKFIKEGSPFFWRRFYCTACGDWTTHGKSKYCPNCGARMEE